MRKNGFRDSQPESASGTRYRTKVRLHSPCQTHFAGKSGCFSREFSVPRPGERYSTAPVAAFCYIGVFQNRRGLKLPLKYIMQRNENLSGGTTFGA
jgi:hypothetical protein